jgi:hypothetical protein
MTAPANRGGRGITESNDQAVQVRRRIDFEMANNFGWHTSKKEIGISSAAQLTVKKTPPRNHL